MKLMTLARALTAVLAGFGAAGAAGAQDAPKPTRSLAISVKQYQAKVGDPVPLAVEVTNVSDHDIWMALLNGGNLHRMIHLVVSDGNGNPVQLTEEGKRIHGEGTGAPVAISAFSFPLKPGQGMREDADLAKEFDLKKPGTYTVHAEVRDGKQVVKSN